MTDHKKQMLSPQNGLRSSFKPSNLTNGLKSLQNLHSGPTKAEQKKPALHHPVTATHIVKAPKQRPESPKVQKVPLGIKKPDPKLVTAPKKPIGIDTKNISSPRAHKEDLTAVKSPAAKTTSNHMTKEQLRTTFTPTTFTAKVYDPKQGLRKTTLAPNRQHELKATEIASSNVKTPTVEMKKPNFEKRFQTSHHEFIGKHPPSKTPSTISQKKDKQPKEPKEPPNIVCGFVLLKTVGAGRFGEVLMARHATLGFLCALKKIVKAKVIESNMLNQVVQEIKLQAFISNPNIVQFYGLVSDQDNIYIILEYMQGGTLFDYMNDKQKLTEDETAGFIREITNAVKSLHDMNIAHRDIKPENIVLNYGVAKLCDFGWSARVQGSRKTYCGTFDYAPPEILERKEYDLSVDLWNLGVLAYELMTGKIPFEHEQRKVVMQKIVNVDKDHINFPEDMSSAAKDFILNLVKKNPDQRMKSYKLLNHPFLDRPDHHRKPGNN